MLNHATIFLIDLGPRASAMQKALSAMGFQVGAGSHQQLIEVVGQALPDVVVAPESILGEIKATLESVAGGADALVFLLSDDTAVLGNRVPPGATARVPVDIDPGVLGLRIQAAAQTSTNMRNRQATLVGFSPSDLLGTPGFPQKAPSVPPAMKAPPFSQAPLSQPPLSQAPLSQPPLSQASPHQPAPAAPPSRVMSSAPPLAPTPEPPPLGFEDSALPPLVFPPPHETSATSASPVALTVPPEAMESSASRKKLIFSSAIAAAILLGVGVFVLSGGPSEGVTAAGEAEATEELATGKEEPTVNKPSAELASTKAEGENAPKISGELADASQKADAQVIDKSADAVDLNSKTEDSDSALFRIAAAKELPSCETQLGKSEADYQGTAKWRSGQAWSQARKSLMSGKQEQAAKQMCEWAFIDPKGPAVAGLVNYYLSERALEQAHKWALKGVEVSPKSRAAQEALGDVLNQMGRIDEAREVWLTSFGLKDESDTKIAGVIKNYVRSAVAARKGGAYPLAERLLRRALSFEPNHAEASALFVTTLRKNGEDKLAERWESRASQP